MINNYCTVAQLESYLMTDISSSFEPYVERYIESASRFIDNYTGNNFSATPETRYFISDEPRELYIDNVSIITKVELYNYSSETVERTVASTEYDLYPLNPSNGNYSKNKIVMKPNKTGLIVGRKVAVTGNFGTVANLAGDVPRDIEYACIALAAEAVRQGRDGGIPGSESLGEYNVSFQKILETDIKMVNIKEILDRYKIITVG